MEELIVLPDAGLAVQGRDYGGGVLTHHTDIVVNMWGWKN